MKKFITIALAVAVLFSFAACQEPIDVNGYVPTGLSIQYNGEDILAGEAFDATQYSATITYKNGKPGEYAGQFALMDSDDAATTKYAAGVYVTASVQGETAPIAAVYTPTVYTVEKVVADVSGATVKEVAVSDADAPVGLDGVTVTAYYDNGKTKDVTSIAKATVDASAAGTDKAVTFAQVLSQTVTVEGEWKVNVVDAKTYDESKFSHLDITVEYQDATSNAKQDTAWITDKAVITVKAVDSNGNTKTLDYAPSSIDGSKYAASESTAALTVGKDAKTITITAVQNNKVVQDTATIDAGTDYVKAITAVAASGSYAAGETVPTTALTATCTWASGESEGKVYAGSYAFPNGGKAPTSTGNITVFCTYGKNYSQVSEQNVSITVK